MEFWYIDSFDILIVNWEVFLIVLFREKIIGKKSGNENGGKVWKEVILLRLVL